MVKPIWKLKVTTDSEYLIDFIFTEYLIDFIFNFKIYNYFRQLR